MADLTNTVSYPGLTSILAVQATFPNGVDPGRIEITTAQPAAQAPASVGDVAMLDGTRTVTLPGCALVGSRVSARGSQRVFLFEDRRWRWRTGHIDGAYNQRSDDDETLANEKNPQELFTLLFQAVGETVFDVSGASTAPRPEVEWIGANPAQELKALCDRLGYVVSWNTSGQPYIATAGVGVALPPNALAETDEYTASRRPPPAAVRAKCGPTQYELRFRLRPVGLEANGDVAQLNDLSYALDPDDGLGAGGFSREGDAFGSLTGYETDPNGKQILKRDLARRSVWKMYEIWGVVDGEGPNSLNPPGWPFDDLTSIDQLLPIRDAVNEFTTWYGKNRQLNSRVFGSYFKAEFVDQNVTDEQYHLDHSIDEDRGIVLFSQPVYRIETQGPNAEQRYEADMTLVAVCEIDEPATNVKAYYALTRSTGVSGGPAVVTRDVDEAVYRVTYDPANPSTPITNQTVVDLELGFYLDQMELEYVQENGGTVAYNGIHAFQLDGLRQSISWSLGVGQPSRTVVGLNNESNPYAPGYKESQEEAARVTEDRHVRRRRERREASERRRANRQARYFRRYN